MPRKKNSRRAHGEGSIRQRPDGKWEGRLTVGRDPGTGKQLRRSFYGDAEADVRKQMTQARADLDNGTYQEPSKMTVSQWLDIWIREYTGNLKDRTQTEYEKLISYRIKPAIGAIKLSALKTHQVQSAYNKALNGAENKRAVSPKTVKNIHGVLHKALSQAVEIGYIRANPADACKLPRIEKKEIKPLDDEQIAAFLEAIQGHRFERLYTVGLFSGARQGELLGLPWKNVNFKDGSILIAQQMQLHKGEYKIVSVKNDKARRITPAPSIMAVLKEQKSRQAEWQLRAGSAWENEWGLVFTNEIGHHLARQTVYSNYKRIVKKLGIDESRFHDLRHSYAVASIQSGDDIKTIQGNLGHHSASFTMDTYMHVTEKMRRDSADRMEKFIKSVKKA